MPCFSVIIPTYNSANLICRAIESVFNQSFTDFELLIMDDGSNDGTEDLIKSYRDERIGYDWASNSGGPASPRNRGLRLAKGRWIAFLDADDLWYPNKLEIVYATIEKNPYVAAVCHNEYTRRECEQKKRLICHGPYEEDFYKLMLLQGNRVSTSAVILRHQFLKKYNLSFNTKKEFAIVEDYDLWLRISYYGGVFKFIKEPLGEYILQKNNLTSDRIRHNTNRLKLLKEHVFEFQTFDKNKKRLWMKISTRISFLYAKEYASNKKFIEAIKVLIYNFINSPIYSVLNIYWFIKRKLFLYKTNMMIK